MPSKQPALGSLSVQLPPANPQFIRVTSSTCHNLSLFKDLLKEYRKLDDSVTMRFNRTTAQFRDRDRLSATGSSRGNPQGEACAYFWAELVENWKKRAEIINFCVDVVDGPTSIEQKKETESRDTNLDADRSSHSVSYAEAVKRKQIRNELTVEAIVRQRSLDAFKNRCRYFEPPLSDVEARKWWDAAQRGR